MSELTAKWRHVAGPTISFLWGKVAACRVLSLAGLVALVAVACSGFQGNDPDSEPEDDDDFGTNFPRLDYGFGHQTHLLFSYDGPVESASTIRKVTEKGISDDPRVQRFVDRFREVMAARRYIPEWLLSREDDALSYLSEVVYLGGHRLEDAYVSTRERNGRMEKYYRWKDISGEWSMGAFEDELGTRLIVESSLRAVYGRPGATANWNGFLQIWVTCSREGEVGRDPSDRRNSQLFKYGVMGVISPATDDDVPPKLVQNVIVIISSRPGAPAHAIDEFVVEALNLALTDGEKIYIYPNASLNEFADSNERIEFYSSRVNKLTVLPAEPR